MPFHGPVDNRFDLNDASPLLPIHSASRTTIGIAASLLILAAILAYAGTLNDPFVYDDKWNITNNPSIRSLWPLTTVLRGSTDTGIAGRPLVNLSFALNYAVGKNAATGYHLVNLCLHILAALTLFGILRRTFSMTRLNETFGSAATGLGFLCALLFVVHPIQTGAVTYTTQRLESLMGLCFLLTLYGAVRGWQTDRPGRWHLLAVAAFWAGVGAKEVIVAVPFVVFFYDYTFRQGRIRDLLMRSPILYSGFFAGLSFMAWLVGSGLTAEWAYAATPAYTPTRYLMIQSSVILHYLRLVLWPDGLCFDYGWPEDNVNGWYAATLPDMWPNLLVLGLLMTGSLAALWRRHPVGLPGMWFFCILAPTSSVVPLYSIAAEHRMYLPLAGVIVFLVTLAYRVCRRIAVPYAQKRRWLKAGGVLFLCLLVAGLTLATMSRNAVYRSRVSLWSDTVDKAPGNSRAHQNLGSALVDVGKTGQGVAHYKEALRLRPGDAVLHANLGVALTRMGRLQEAADHYRRALGINPDDAKTLVNLGIIEAEAGRMVTAIGHFKKAVAVSPAYAEAHNNLGYAYLLTHRYAAARQHLKTALTLRPGFEAAANNLKRLDALSVEKSGS